MAAPIEGLTQAARAAGMPTGGYVPTGMIHWWVNRQHVSMSECAIARAFWHERAKAYPRPLKRAIVRAAILAHRQNVALFRHYRF